MLDYILGDVGIVIERGPLKYIVSVTIGLGERVAVFLDEGTEFLEVSVGGSGVDI